MVGGRALRRLRAQLFAWSGAGARARRRLDGSRAAVLMYHRVLPRTEARRLAVEPGMFVTPETFALHCAVLAERFRVLPLHEVVERLAAGEDLPRGACAITFDDGWRDNLEFALPALERWRHPATLFAVSERVGTAGAFWPDEVCRRLAGVSPAEAGRLVCALGAAASRDPADALLAHLKTLGETGRADVLEQLRTRTPSPPPAARELLDWPELDRLAEGGVEVESHGASHALLTGLADDEALRELEASRAGLAAHGHARHGLLAYPSGDHDARIQALAARAGYRAAVTTVRGLADARVSPMALPRIALHDDVSSTRVEFLRAVPGPP